MENEIILEVLPLHSIKASDTFERADKIHLVLDRKFLRHLETGTPEYREKFMKWMTVGLRWALKI